MAASAIVPPKGFQLESPVQPPAGFVLEGQSAPGQKLSFTGEMNPETRQFQDVSVDQPKVQDAGVLAAIKRGVSNIASLPSAVYHAATDAPTPEEQAAGSTIAGQTGLPTQAGVAINRLFVQPQVKTWEKAAQETDQPGDNNWDNATERAHMHKIAALIPVVGPLADSLAQRWLAGDKSGAAAELATYLVVPKAIEEGKAAVPPIVRGAAKVGNAAIQNAPAIGTVVGGIGGMLEHGTEGGIVGMYTGNKIGKLIKERAPTIPGEDFGLNHPDTPKFTEPQRVADISQLGPPKPVTPEPQPESGAAAEARAHFEQKLAARKAAKPASSTPEATQQAAPLPSENDVAKGMGYKSAQQAQERLGPQQWQETYNKIAKPAEVAPKPQAAPVIDTPAKAQKAVSDLVDQVAPGATLKNKGEIDFQLRKGNIEQAKQMLDDILEEKGLQQENRSGMEEDRIGVERYKQRLNRAKSSGAHNKGSLMSAEDVVDSMPAPFADMNTNKLLGYDGRRTIQEATQIRKDAMQPDLDAPWGGLKPKGYTDTVKQFLRLYYGEGNALKPRPSR